MVPCLVTLTALNASRGLSETAEFLVENIIWQQVKRNYMQFRYVSGECTTDAIFVVRQLHKKCTAKGRIIRECIRRAYITTLSFRRALNFFNRSSVSWRCSIDAVSLCYKKSSRSYSNTYQTAFTSKNAWYTICDCITGRAVRIECNDRVVIFAVQ